MLLLSAGSNACGQLSNSTTDDSYIFQPVIWSTPPPSEQSAVFKLACGANHTLVLLDNGKLYGCGDASKGQLGPLNSCTSLSNLVLPLEHLGLAGYIAVNVASAWETSYVVLQCEGRDDVLLSMGSNDYGDLGIGTIGSKAACTINLISLAPAFDKTLRKGSLEILDIAAGTHHTVVLLAGTTEEGDHLSLAAGWGACRQGQLGSSSQKGSTCPSPRVLSLHYPSVPVSIALGSSHSVILHEDGNVSVFGSNKKAQLESLTSRPTVFSQVQCSWNGTYAVPIKMEDLSSSERYVVASGSNRHGQLGSTGLDLSFNAIAFPNHLSSSDLQLAAGSEHCLALFRRAESGVFTDRGASVSAEVWGWGWNEHGNLGLGHTRDVDLPQKLWPRGGDDSGDVRNVWAGCGTSWLWIIR